MLWMEALRETPNSIPPERSRYTLHSARVAPCINLIITGHSQENQVIVLLREKKFFLKKTGVLKN